MGRLDCVRAERSRHGVPVWHTGNTDPHRQALVAFTLSQDAGSTWQSLTTSMRAGVWCVVDIDPTNAHDLLIEAWPCLSSASVSCAAQPLP
jgi:hypothetical protein